MFDLLQAHQYNIGKNGIKEDEIVALNSIGGQHR